MAAFQANPRRAIQDIASMVLVVFLFYETGILQRLHVLLKGP